MARQNTLNYLENIPLENPTQEEKDTIKKWSRASAADLWKFDKLSKVERQAAVAQWNKENPDGPSLQESNAYSWAVEYIKTMDKLGKLEE